MRRLAAIEGYEMLSTDEKDEPFVLEQDECWVLADNESLKPKVLAIFGNLIIMFRQMYQIYLLGYYTVTLWVYPHFLFMFYYLELAIAQQPSGLPSLH